MIQASLTRRWGWFWACLLGVIAYLVLGIYALWGVTAWIYVVLAVFVHISVAADLSSAQLRLETVEDKGIDLAFERERTKQAQAAARKAKAEQIVFPKTFGANGVRSDKTNTEQGELQARIYAELEQDSTIGPREMSRRVGCAPSTAKAHIDKWRANQ